MPFRLPLSAKIIAWFLLNLVLLAAGFYVLFRVEFAQGFDAFFSSVAGPRVQAVSLAVSAQLQAQPRKEWTSVLERFSKAYGVKMSLYNNDGPLRAGEELNLPPEVLRLLRQAPPRHGPPHEGPPDGFDPLDELLGPAEHPRDPMDFSKFLTQTSSPTAYWCGIKIPVQKRRPPEPVTLIIRSDSIHGGGLFFDIKPWLITGFGALLLSLIFWTPLVTSITRALRRVTDATGRIAEGDFTVRVPASRQDELGMLGGSVNRMAERLDGFVTGQKRFLGDIAHELCSPIARMQTALGIIEQTGAGAHEKNVERINRELQHMSELVNELLSFSKANLHRDVALQAIKLKPVVQRAIEREGMNSAKLSLEVPDDLTVLAEPELLTRAIANVLRNALRYAGHESPIQISARILSSDETVLTIRDHGPGVPEESLSKIFDAFYRPDEARTREAGGVGLGLAIVKSCVEACSGRVTASNPEGGGLELSFRLVRAE